METAPHRVLLHLVFPILFLVYINDLLGSALSQMRLVADDTVIYNFFNRNGKLPGICPTKFRVYQIQPEENQGC